MIPSARADGNFSSCPPQPSRPDSGHRNPPAASHDPAENFTNTIDPGLLALAARWHAGFDGGAHITAQAVERLEVDLFVIGRTEARA